MEPKEPGRCSACKGALGGAASDATCDRCKVTYHARCLTEGGCTTPACRERPSRLGFLGRVGAWLLLVLAMCAVPRSSSWTFLQTDWSTGDTRASTEDTYGVPLPCIRLSGTSWSNESSQGGIEVDPAPFLANALLALVVVYVGSKVGGSLVARRRATMPNG